MKTDSVNVLLVEDDEVDVAGIRRNFKKHKIVNPVFRAIDGIDAIEMLRGENGNEVINRPYIILLDLNMPRMGGIEFLKVIREDELLKDSIVFVLTTSDAKGDIKAAYENNVAGYLTKANVGEGFIKLIAMLTGYWGIVEFPGRL